MEVLQSTVAPVEGKVRRSVPSLPAIMPDRLKTSKTLAEKAVKSRKVFSVQGPYPVIRAALWARGWVERRLPNLVKRVPRCLGDEEEDGDDDREDEGKKEENLDDMYDFMSRLVRNETTYFYWTVRRDYIDCRFLQSDQMTNHYANSGAFTTKVGLCVNLRNLRWFDAADPDTFFPRCYRLGAEDEKHAFKEDFRRTACTSLLQHVVETSKCKQDGVKDLNDGHQQFVAPRIINLALHVCEEFLGVLEHSDIDVTVGTPPSVGEGRWEEFLQDYYKVVHEGALIRGSSAFVERCQAMLIRLQEVCPQLDTDGLHNIWIIKPGIMCMNRLDEILAFVESDRAPNKESKWVIQKYLERPLLVHGTKFDLRQWFLVTDWNPLTVWFYMECYLRFSTQPYSTKSLDSSVHLCNNSVQKHFQPSCYRHPEIPEDNMWSCSQFKAFLQRQGLGEKWEAVVVPGMQKAVVRALQTAQDVVEPRKTSFELYGADFMLGRDLRPWLLEINSSPTMACSTTVTARLCPAVQLDTLRVVLDRRTDPSAYTGGFQMIYKQAAVEVPQYKGVYLLVEGASMRQSRPPLHRKIVTSNPHLKILSSSDTSSEGDETAHHKSGQRSSKVSSSLRSGKENQTSGEKKRQLTRTSPKRGGKVRAEGHIASSVRRFSCSSTSEQPLLVHIEPKKKTMCLGLNLGAKGETLVPTSLSFPLRPHRSTLSCRSQPNPGQRVHILRSSLPQTMCKPRYYTSTRVFPPLQGPLPILEVLSLRPNVVNKTTSRLSENSTKP
ncbi:tubulin monoglycylase TTLL3 isoform X1 [Xyrichtys novacula]|uniref:Tubulin monoglycylase TTLL3 isoform X1 n=1 Tax=Xyrichtys novacula TaxID=13765 RepID=A0AAV1EQR8_XYRNO|nr:tubulin monoglycylase TTLL3 isoform X1 [Xyrichtys novacula]